MILKNAVLSVFVLLSAMAFGYAPRSYDVKSEVMDKSVPVTVLLPRGYDEHPEKRYSVVYLLHGAGDTDMHAYHPLFREAVDRHGFILVAPRGTRTWWMDSPVDPKYRYETFVVRELLPWVDGRYRTLAGRAHRALLGNSMGGHGAMYLALRHRDLFGAVGNIFGGLDLWAWRDSGR